MRLGIVGSRHNNSDRVRDIIHAIASSREVTVVVTGAAPGVDTAAADYARAQGIPLREYAPRAMVAHELLARNTRIAEDCDELLALPCGCSSGTYDTIRKAKARGVPVIQILVSCPRCGV